MVIKRVLAVILLLAATFAGAQAAGKKLDVSVDRKQLHEDETLQLRVVGNVKLHLSFSNLWNLNNLQLPKPDLGSLEQDFTILNRNQSYNIRSINGNTTAKVTWTYVLAPKRSGQLEIPALHYKDASSDPIPITVLPGSGGVSGAGSGASLKVKLDQASVYVQQQVILTEELSYRGPLIKGNLDSLDLDNAIVQELGKPEKFTRTQDGQVYHILRRQFALFPQNPGSLEIPPQSFSGEAQNQVTGNIRYLHAASKAKTVKVRPQPKSFQGTTWLPATSLLVTDKFSQPLDSIHVGDSVTRTIKIQALGQMDSSLPPLNSVYPASVKSYPDQPKLQSGENNGTLESSRTQPVALVPTRAGTVQLPAIRIPWWDTVNNVERYAEIPAKTIRVLPASGQATTSGAQPGGAGQTPQNGRSASSPQPSPVASSAPAGSARPAGGGAAILGSIWFWVALILALGWVLTIVLWWRQQQRNKRPKPSEPQSRNDNTAPTSDKLYGELREALLSGRAQALNLLPYWARQHFRNPALQSVADVGNYFKDDRLSAQLDALERHLYANPEQRGTWDGTALVQRLDELKKRGRSGRKGHDGGLPPLYSFERPEDQ